MALSNADRHIPITLISLALLFLIPLGDTFTDFLYLITISISTLAILRTLIAFALNNYADSFIYLCLAILAVILTVFVAQA